MYNQSYNENITFYKQRHAGRFNGQNFNYVFVNFSWALRLRRYHARPVLPNFLQTAPVSLITFRIAGFYSILAGYAVATHIWIEFARKIWPHDWFCKWKCVKVTGGKRNEHSPPSLEWNKRFLRSCYESNKYRMYFLSISFLVFHG